MKFRFSDTNWPLSLRAGLILFFLVFIVYCNTFQSEWHFDDRHSILDNSKIHISDLSVKSLSKAIEHPDKPKIWRPLAHLSFSLNWYFGKDSVFGYHIVNILIHFTNAYILYLTILCLLRTPAVHQEYGKQSFIISLLAAVLWVSNPIQTQAVNYIVQRMTLLAALFYLSGIFFYLQARLTSIPRYRYTYFLLCFICWLLALGFKENAIILPLSLMLIEGIFFQKISLSFRQKKFFIIFIAGCFIIAGLGCLFFLRSDPSAVLSGYNDRFFTPYERLLTQPRVLLYYITQIIFPLPGRLSIEHDFALSTSFLQPWHTLPSIIIVFTLILGAAIKAGQWPMACFSILFFFLNHTIESSIVPLEMIFEHRNYIPSMFLFTPVALAIVWLLNRYNMHQPTLFYLTFGLGICLIFSLGMGTYLRNRAWLTEVSLWSDAHHKAPEMHRPVHNLAMALYESTDRFNEALALYHSAEGLKMHRRSHMAWLYSNIANIHFRTGRYDKAETFFEKAHKIAPQKEYILYRLADALRQQKKWDSALIQANKLLQKNTQNSDYLNLKGHILLNMNDPDTAMQMFRLAIRSNPENQAGYINAGVALMAIGANKRAETLLKKGIAAAPHDILPYLRLIVVYLKMDNPDEATKLVQFLVQSASVETIFLSLIDIKEEPFSNTEDYLKLEQIIVGEMEKKLPCITTRCVSR